MVMVETHTLFQYSHMQSFLILARALIASWLRGRVAAWAPCLAGQPEQKALFDAPCGLPPAKSRGSHRESGKVPELFS
jgi:hypothetical protein